MREVQLDVVDAVLADMIDGAARGEPSVISAAGREKTVIVSLADWERASRTASFGQFLMSAPFEEGDIPDRDQTPLRLPDWAR